MNMLLSNIDKDPSMAVTASAEYGERFERALAPFEICSETTYATFETARCGFGPYIVPREDLLDEILKPAGPRRGVHISGCKGA